MTSELRILVVFCTLLAASTDGADDGDFDPTTLLTGELDLTTLLGSGLDPTTLLNGGMDQLDKFISNIKNNDQGDLILGLFKGKQLFHAPSNSCDEDIIPAEMKAIQRCFTCKNGDYSIKPSATWAQCVVHNPNSNSATAQFGVSFLFLPLLLLGFPWK